ncbi:uncharacterized protein EDB93DRAFT_410622 [Suillus bovinus]|uniref:uncharacterized protein n=1 Tax=Suillus bovinus TaxID=48563 RepID=UPI001B864D29|nr:uncharacterized protein EDB93DRAFT_410622 [Suillus bovinus]KAG2125184.1 hypothetical protein EDB93DRAFT_410622 [Suillus bovinus]
MVRQRDAYIILCISECFVQLFGWDLESLLLTTHQKRCQAFLSAGEPDEVLEAHKHMMDAIDEIAKASCLDSSNVQRAMQCTCCARRPYPCSCWKSILHCFIQNLTYSYQRVVRVLVVAFRLCAPHWTARFSIVVCL